LPENVRPKMQIWGLKLKTTILRKFGGGANWNVEHPHSLLL